MAGENKFLNLIIKFLVDQSSLQNVRESIRRLEQSPGGTTGSGMGSGGVSQSGQAASQAAKSFEDLTTAQQASASAGRTVNAVFDQTAQRWRDISSGRFTSAPMTESLNQTAAAATSASESLAGVASQAKVTPQSFQETAKVVEDYASSMGMSIDEAATALDGMAVAGQKSRSQILKDVDAFKQMTPAADQAGKAVEGAGQKIEGFNRKSKAWGKAVMLGVTGFTLSMTGIQLQKFGENLLSPIQKYVEYAGMSSGVSQEWLSITKDLEQSTIRIGEVLATTMLPVMEKIATVAREAAEFIEEHPEVATGIAILGGGTIILGKMAVFIGQMMAGIAAMTNLMGILGQSGLIQGIISTGKAIAVGAGGLLASSAAGAGVGVVGYNMIAEAAGWEKAGTIAGKTLTVLAYQAGKLFGEDTASKWGHSIGVLTNTIEDLGDTASDAAGKIILSEAAIQEATKLRESALQIIENYREQEVEATEEYHRKRSEIIEDYERQVAREVEEYQRTRGQFIEDFYRDEQRSEESYYRQRMDLIRDFGQEALEAEEDFQKELRRMREDHNERMYDLVADRDALGIVREMRAYERKRREAEEDFNDERARRKAQSAQRIADLESDFAYERARRIEEFQIRLKQQEEDFKLQQKRDQEEHQLRLRDLQKNYNEQRQKRYENMRRELEDLVKGLQKRLEIMKRFTDAEVAYVMSAVNSVLRSPGIQVPGTRRMGGYMSRASGGYVGRGLYEVGEEGREYVLNNRTTTTLEKLLGGPLSQQNILASFLGKRQPISIQASISVGSTDPLKQFQHAMQRIAEDVFLQAVGG